MIKVFTGTDTNFANAGNPADYYADLYVKWNKTNKTVMYILSKYNFNKDRKEQVRNIEIKLDTQLSITC